jgi:hypothetical protein
MAQVNPVTYDFYTKKDDTLPALKVKIRNADDYSDFDLTNYTGIFNMAPVSSLNTPKVSGGSVQITNATEGEAQYNWQAGDLDTVGKYYWEMRFTKAGSTFTIPVATRGVVYVESRIESS